MTGELIIVFFLILYLRKSLRETSLQSKWNVILSRALFVIPVILVFDQIVLPAFIAKWIGHFILLALVYLVYTMPDFRTFRNTVLALLPFLLVSFFQDIVKILPGGPYRIVENYFDVLYFCSITWMVAMLVIQNKQRKALVKERQRRELEEEQNRFIAAQKKELEIMVAARTTELQEQKEELEHALHHLKDTQTQLIQKEKMASLGELTAGIAHEIQNPLNFVNNFSEVNKELLEEMEMEINKGNFEEVKVIASDIRVNELKISHHGKRADAIVKGMLLHSRTSSGKKEPTDVNALADEYLRLSYQGLRAKDKTFNVSFSTIFDPQLDKVDMVQQDIGRVLLNLFNNAFYSVNEKKKLLQGDFDPMVTVTTKKSDTEVEIIVSDNGNGIPQKVIDKIFQPFFTTKPSGEGTGLGLSLSYDIIKAHDGELKVETTDGKGATFIISLPLKSAFPIGASK